MADDRNNGRFTAGNPGRRPGSRNKSTMAAMALLEGEAEALTRRCVEMALDGDATAMRLCLERLIPPTKSRRVELPDLPDVASAADVPEALRALLGYVAEGELAPEEAAAIANVLEGSRRAHELVVPEQRLAAVEKAMEGRRR